MFSLATKSVGIRAVPASSQQRFKRVTRQTRVVRPRTRLRLTTQAELMHEQDLGPPLNPNQTSPGPKLSTLRGFELLWPSMADLRVTLLAAMSHGNVIGYKGKLPWSLPNDLKRFNALTMGHTVLMGRVTYESIGKPLKGRRCIVLTTQANYKAPGCLVIPDLSELTPHMYKQRELFVIGGASVYGLFLPNAYRLELTFVDAPLEGDRHFPLIKPEDWNVASRETYYADERHAYDYSFISFERRPRSDVHSGISLELGDTQGLDP